GAFWFAMFSPWTKDTLNFWATMLIATGVLGASALWLGKDELARVYRFETRHLVMGLLFAAGLYAVFKVGHVVSTSLFPFAAGQIDNIYATRTQASPSTIALALLLWIGPSEEVFWRGFVQDRLMRRYGDVAGFVVTTAIYALVHIRAFNFMLFGAALIRIPAADWRPPGWKTPAGPPPAIVAREIGVDLAWRTPQFWLLWIVLCMNVSAGIGILGQASKMCSDMFGVSAAVGGGFAGLLSIFNMGGRFFWSSVSDRIGRKSVYLVYFLFGAVLYCLVPWTQRTQNRPLFVLVTAVIITMYGGGFATIPAYLRDLFGTYQVGAIHGRLITAWSVAALIGPTLVNYISTASIRAGQPSAEAYNSTMYVMAGLLANQMVRPLGTGQLPEAGR
ncbi:MAG: MFS transporter, partial [Acidobacteria bacterium]|nr:MFS transporter [Acidobacteriota bacterium]